MQKGSYVLLLSLQEDQRIRVGGLGAIDFPRGYYAYVGSAMGGFEKRLNRYFSRSRKLHWHIDYLLETAVVRGAIVCESSTRLECDIAGALGSWLDDIPGFGSSDCRCPSHLFFAGEVEGLDTVLMKIFETIGTYSKLTQNIL